MVTYTATGRDCYGRTLAHVLVDGDDVGDRLLAEGLALRWRPGPIAKAQRLAIWVRPMSGRGMAQRSLDLIEAMRDIAEAAQPITGRGVGYKLFTAGLIPSMARSEMQRVYRLLQAGARAGHHSVGVDRRRDPRASSGCRHGTIPTQYARTVARSYRRDFWNQQPHPRRRSGREKGTVRGVLAPVLDHYAVGFLPVHGFTSATSVHDIAEDDDGRPLIVLYVGDFDPSGMFMSEVDLPDALRQIRRRSHHAEAHRADAGAGARAAVVPGRRQAERPALQVVRRQPRRAAAGNWTRWTRTICAIASSGRSRS